MRAGDGKELLLAVMRQAANQDRGWCLAQYASQGAP